MITSACARPIHGPRKCRYSSACFALLTRGVSSFPDLFDDLRAEGLEIARIATGDDAAICDNFFVYPLTARVLHIGLDRMIGSYVATSHSIQLDQQPGCMTHRRNHFARIEK